MSCYPYSAWPDEGDYEETLSRKQRLIKGPGAYNAVIDTTPWPVFGARIRYSLRDAATAGAIWAFYEQMGGMKGQFWFASFAHNAWRNNVYCGTGNGVFTSFIAPIYTMSLTSPVPTVYIDNVAVSASNYTLSAEVTEPYRTNIAFKNGVVPATGAVVTISASGRLVKQCRFSSEALAVTRTEGGYAWEFSVIESA